MQLQVLRKILWKSPQNHQKLIMLCILREGGGHIKTSCKLENLILLQVLCNIEYPKRQNALIAREEVIPPCTSIVPIILALSAALKLNSYHCLSAQILRSRPSRHYFTSYSHHKFRITNYKKSQALSTTH